MLNVWKTVMFDGLISSCYPWNPYAKVGNEKKQKKQKEMEFFRPLENEYPSKSQSN